MKGSGIRYLRLILREPASDQVLWEREGHQGTTWTMVNITVCTAARTQFVFETAFTMPDHLVGIDEIVYQAEFDADLAEPGRCPVVSCNFESNLCGWNNIAQGSSPNARWVRSNLLVEEADHVEASPDGFWHLETSGRPNLNRSISRIITPCIRLNNPTTIDFWYHSYGYGIEYLRLIAVFADGSETKLWEIITQSQSWQRPIVLLAGGIDMRLILEAAFNDSGVVMAVDKIKLLNEAEQLVLSSNCVAAATTGLPVTGTTEEAVFTTMVPSSRTFTCSFDRDFCGWQGSGFISVAVTEAISAQAGARFAFAPLASGSATLASSLTAQTEATQMFFYYFAHRDVEEITVSAHFVQGVVRQLWSLAGTAGPSNFGRWIPVRISLCMSGRFRLIITVTKKSGASSSSGFGLDELIINGESTALTTGPSNFICPSGPLSGNSESVTCELDYRVTNLTTFCGWQHHESVAVTVQVGPVPGLSSNMVGLVLIPNITAGNGEVTLESASLPPTTTATTFSFWYVLRGSRMQAEVVVNNQSYPLIGAVAMDEWMVRSIQLLPRFSTASTKIEFRVSISDAALIRQSSGVRADGDVLELFALGNTWYSAEPGFAPEPQTDTTGTAGPQTTTSQPATPAVTGESSVLPPSRPTTPAPAPRMSQENIIIASVGSVAGALILLAIFVGLLHCRSKRREKKKGDSEVAMTEIPLNERGSTRSVPPAYTSAPGTVGASSAPVPAPAVVYKRRGFDEEVERL